MRQFQLKKLAVTVHSDAQLGVVVVVVGMAEVVEETMERVGLGGRLRDGPVSGLRRA